MKVVLKLLFPGGDLTIILTGRQFSRKMAGGRGVREAPGVLTSPSHPQDISRMNSGGLPAQLVPQYNTIIHSDKVSRQTSEETVDLT